MGRTDPVVIADAGPVIHLDESGLSGFAGGFRPRVLVPEAWFGWRSNGIGRWRH
jgi:hypothetical protein